jgi:hypothetical protein
MAPPLPVQSYLEWTLAMPLELDASCQPQSNIPWVAANPGSRVLTVEDEMFVAMDIDLVVQKAGHQVVGFAGRRGVGG